jgi:hypothetical protein
MLIRQLHEVRDGLRGAAAEFDPALVSGADASTVVELCAEIEHLAAGTRMLAAGRVADTGAWRSSGERSAAHWLARAAGTGVGEAVSTLQTSEKLHHLAATRKAVQQGELSPRQAQLVASAAAADPSAEQALLAAAEQESLGELRDRSLRTRAAAQHDERGRHQAVHRSRHFRHRVEADGAWIGTIRNTPEVGALLVAAINDLRRGIFERARRDGQREPSEAYDADAVAELARRHLAQRHGMPVEPASPAVEPSLFAPDATGAAAPDSASGIDAPAVAPGGGTAAPIDRSRATAVEEVLLTASPRSATSPPDEARECGTSPAQAPAIEAPASGEPSSCAGSGPSPPAARRNTGSRCSLIARADHTAVLRGETRPGETCEITGIGPIPVHVLRQLLPHSFLAVVVTDDADEVQTVAHLGRASRFAKAAAQQFGPTGELPGARPAATPAPDPLTALGATMKIIVRVHARALSTRDDTGPPSDTDPFLACLAARGVDLAARVHHHRQFSAHQRTALEHRDPTCAVLGCAAVWHLERDHRADWSATHTTSSLQGDHLCHAHHWLKTHRGFSLEPGTGKRRFLPPSGQSP